MEISKVSDLIKKMCDEDDEFKRLYEIENQKLEQEVKKKLSEDSKS